MTQLYLENEYFDWLCSHINDNLFVSKHQKLLAFLHCKKFIFSIPLDANRADDGINLRYRFGDEKGYDQRFIATELDISQCSVLEMMIALSKRCEINIMDNPDIGDRTGVWFLEMIKNLGLIDMHDDIYDKDKVSFAINRLLERKYEPNGKYGLFTVQNPRRDMRKTEIWYQAMWYLDEVLQI